jgi:hypothetical protein
MTSAFTQDGISLHQLGSYMTLDEYNEAIQKIVAEQQNIAQTTVQLAMSGQANPANPQFAQLMTSQWALVQQIAKLNMDLMMGVWAPKK